jgi:hypothetical protein
VERRQLPFGAATTLGIISAMLVVRLFSFLVFLHSFALESSFIAPAPQRCAGTSLWDGDQLILSDEEKFFLRLITTFWGLFAYTSILSTGVSVNNGCSVVSYLFFFFFPLIGFIDERIQSDIFFSYVKVYTLSFMERIGRTV